MPQALLTHADIATLVSHSKLDHRFLTKMDFEVVKVKQEDFSKLLNHFLNFSRCAKKTKNAVVYDSNYITLSYTRQVRLCIIHLHMTALWSYLGTNKSVKARNWKSTTNEICLNVSDQ